VKETIESMAKPGLLDFAREIFVRAGNAHVESRCRRCGFRIAADSAALFALLERRHADACRGAVAD
jgi:hypothetical protein